MNIFEEVAQLGKAFLSWMGITFAFSLFFFGFGFRQAALFGLTLYYPIPSLNSISVYFLEIAKRDLLLGEIQVIVLNPLEAFLSLVIISLLLGLISSSPFFIYKAIKYLAPALHQTEKKAIFKILIPSSILFILGCLFAYFLIIPTTFKALYSFVIAIGAEPFFCLTQFVSMVFALMIVVGIIFLLPVFMVLLSKMGIVSDNFWMENWRYAILIFFIFSAIITPDGTGITMMMLSIPFMGLYFAGILLLKNSKGTKAPTE